MDEHEDINYKTLRKLQQSEQASSLLTKIHTGFYKDLSSYLKTLGHSIENESNPLKLKLFTDEIQNTKKIANNIYELREKKIVQAALATVRGATPDLTNFLEIEKRLYTALVDQILVSRREILEQPADPIAKTSLSVLKTPPQEIPESNTQPIVQVLQDTPQFIGTDGKAYSLRTEDVLSLPNEMAEPLLKRKVVKQVK